MVRTLRPKARDPPRRPIPTLGNAAASTALPQPPRTSHKVPTNSAVRRLLIGMIAPYLRNIRALSGGAASTRDGDEGLREKKRCHGRKQAARAPRRGGAAP